MAAESDNLVLEHLRYIRGRVDRLDDRMGAFETRLASVEHHLGALVSGEMGQNSEIDRLRRRVDRIERRLELSDQE